MLTQKEIINLVVIGILLEKGFTLQIIIKLFEERGDLRKHVN